jgi:CRISPR-associated protein Cmr2
MQSYLILFSVGPVQRFIAQARKTQDLYAGSRLLSELINQAQNAIENAAPGAEHIFPLKDAKSKPNKTMGAIVKVAAIDEVMELVEKTVRQWWLLQAKKLWENRAKDNKSIHPYFEAQIQKHLEVYWVALELQTDYSNYKSVYKQLDPLLGAVKALRPFEQLVEDPGPKCHLNGEYNAIIYSNHIKDGYNHLIEEKEGLCAVSFLKRFYELDKFPSTAEIALMATKKELRGQFNLYKDQCISWGIGEEKFDHQLYFEENINERYFKKNKLDKAIPNLSKIREGLLKISKKGLKLSKYYAILVFDVDKMGKTLSGEFLPKDQDLMAFHKKISSLLTGFAETAKAYVHENEIRPEERKGYGSVIYAGGDDFLGFINLNYILEVLAYLRKVFKETVANRLELIENGKKKELSFSAGIAIAHYKQPLSEVLQAARAAEEAAKDAGRNAFCIQAMKHSGDTIKATFSFDDQLQSITLLQELIHYFNTETISNTFMYSLKQEFGLLVPESGELPQVKILSSEMKRLIQRSVKDKEKQKPVMDCAEKLVDLFRIKKDFSMLLSTLQITDFIARQINEIEN